LVGAFTSNRAWFALLGLVLSLALSGCNRAETVQEALGYEQTGPDEMAVIKRPPLILPPDYNLRPPRPGDQDAAGRVAASGAARKTLIGRSSSNGGETNGEGEADDARAVLIGGSSENRTEKRSAADVESEGQKLLVSRTDRAQRDLDELAETRGENRVDGALLRRLLAWTSEDRPAAAEGEAPASVVQVVGRSQTPIDAQTNAE